MLRDSALDSSTESPSEHMEEDGEELLRPWKAKPVRSQNIITTSYIHRRRLLNDKMLFDMCSLFYCCLLTTSIILLGALSLQHAMNLYGYQCRHSLLEPILLIATNILECFDSIALDLLERAEQFEFLERAHMFAQSSHADPASLDEPPTQDHPAGWWDWWYGTDTTKDEPPMQDHPAGWWDWWYGTDTTKKDT